MKTAAVVGAGSWGTALAIVLADNGCRVKLWGRRKEQVEEINSQHTNERYLPDVVLPKQIIGTHSLEDAVSDAETVVLVVPTGAMRKVLRDLNGILTGAVSIVHASKGVEPDTLKRISEIIEEEIHTEKRTGVAVLSGPSHAEEVSARQPTTVTAASADEETAAYI